MFEKQLSIGDAKDSLTATESELSKAEQKRVPEKLERDHREVVVNGRTIREQEPVFERMRLGILAGLQGVKDFIGVSDSEKALKEIERLEKQISEMQEEEPNNE